MNLNDIGVQKQTYINKLMELINLPDSIFHNEEIALLYTKYCKFCFNNQLPTFDKNLDDTACSLYVIDVDPIDYEIDDDRKMLAFEHLQKL